MMICIYCYHCKAPVEKFKIAYDAVKECFIILTLCHGVVTTRDINQHDAMFGLTGDFKK